MSLIRLNSIKGSLNVITGCGSGLGKATLEWFLKRECGPTLGIDIQYEDNYEETLDLNDEQRSRLVLRKHGTFNAKDVESSLKDFVSKNGTIDNVINVAGVALAFTFYNDNSKSIYSIKHASDLVKFNTLGTFNMIRLASRFMTDCALQEEQKKSRCIINTSCISTSKPSIGQTFYAASNGSIDSMTLCVARELSPFNIRCNTINVGYFDSRLARASEERVCNYIAKEVSLCPKRLGTPNEFAHLVQAIVENSMLNGCCIKLDAGTIAAHDS